jgi:hypothetical protein
VTTINEYLRDGGAPTCALDHLGALRRLHLDIHVDPVGDTALPQQSLRCPTVGAPGFGVELNIRFCHLDPPSKATSPAF